MWNKGYALDGWNRQLFFQHTLAKMLNTNLYKVDNLTKSGSPKAKTNEGVDGFFIF